jgi:hypothetical protein
MQVIASWTGGHADALRQSLRMTNESFAEYLGVAARTVAYWRERPDIIPKSAMQETLDTALERAPDRARAQFALLMGEPEHGKQAVHAQAFEIPVRVPAPGVSPESSLILPGTGMDDAARRVLVGQSVTSDCAPPNFYLLTASEAIRREMEDTLAAGTVTLTRLDRIEETVAAHIRIYTSTPPTAALAGLLSDFVDVRRLCAERQPAVIQGRLCEVVALLATLAADSLMKLGQVSEAHAWYGTARIAADDTRNRELRARVRAQEAMLPYYYGDLGDVIRLVRDAQGILDGTPCAAGALALAAEARALSRRPGCRADTERAMADAQDLVGRIGEQDNDDAFRFGERRLLFYLSSTLTNLGESARAARIQDEAFSLYGDAPGLIDPVLIRLDQVQMLTSEGDLDGARNLAEQTCLGLTSERRTPIVAARLRQIITAIPETDETYRALSELHQAVIKPNGLGPDSR